MVNDGKGVKNPNQSLRKTKVSNFLKDLKSCWVF